MGAALVLGSAISYALYLSYSGELVQRLGSLRLVGLATSVACVLCIAQFVILRPLDTAFAVAPEVLWLSLLNAIACTVVPVMLVMMAIERIGSGLAAQVGMVGPMSTILMGVLLLDEPMNLWVIGGTILVLLGVYVVSTWREGAGAWITSIAKDWVWTWESKANGRWSVVPARGWAWAARKHWPPRA